ncbi:GIY-YIG nuclease family protein [Paracoccus sp. M683]|uniref:GIY-YIG nuclease family protein n=1 Tax=Paracoccus sp. M683 TaxID=2594268 RepID=UPI00117E8EF8|nr:GIY-YIG nuclease family protein [Paracoccus sp. M683]TRW97478.1 GIY-YIG nuclease family protein [Paracoccus sp. M683]
MKLTLDHLLAEMEIDPAKVVVMRHSPREPTLKRVFPGLVRTRPDLLDVYQRLQSPRAEAAMRKAGWLVSCAGESAGTAVLLGIFQITGYKVMSRPNLEQLPLQQELLQLGQSNQGWRDTMVQFDLQHLPTEYDLRLILSWPGKELSWYRWAHNNTFEISSILPHAQIDPPLPDWPVLALDWKEIGTLPNSWKQALQQWRGVYHILDRDTGKGYVGSAGGEQNKLGRWRNYSQNGHGGNLGLTGVIPETLRFSILERTSPDLPSATLIALDSSWKARLSTGEFGLNRN